MSKLRRRKSDLDLGHGIWLRFYAWTPEDLPANRARYGTPLPRVARAGAIFVHPRADGTPGECYGSVRFALPEMAALGDAAPTWQVQSWDPLTLSPSILCRECGAHGFVREGRWVPA